MSGHRIICSLNPDSRVNAVAGSAMFSSFPLINFVPLTTYCAVLLSPT